MEEGRDVFEVIFRAQPSGIPPAEPGLPMLVASPVPWSLLADRVRKENPRLDGARAGAAAPGRGGLARTPIPEAQALALNITHPWTSVFHLIWRLRRIAERRIVQYGKMYDPLWSRSTYDATRSLRAPCPRPGLTDLQGASIDATTARLRVAYQWPMGEYPPIPTAWDACCSVCRSAAYLTADFIARLGGGGGWPQTPNPGLCTCQQGGVVYGLEKPKNGWSSKPADNWPYFLYQDPGFWLAVLLEERLGSGTAAADRLWERIEQYPLRTHLAHGNESLELKLGALALYGGQIVFRNLYELLHELITGPDGPEIAGSVGASTLEAGLLRVRDTITSGQRNGWYGLSAVGSTPYPFDDLMDIRNRTCAAPNAEFESWAGGVYVGPDGDPLPDGYRLPDDTVIDTALAPPTSYRLRAAVPGWAIGVGGVALAATAGILWYRRRRRRTEARGRRR